MQTFAEALSRALTTADVAAAVFGHLLPAAGASAGTFVLPTEDGAALELVGAVGRTPATLNVFRRIPLDAPTPAAEVVRTRQPRWISSLADATPGLPLVERPTGHQALAILPLVLGEHRTGALALAFADERSFDAAERSLLTVLAAQCAVALQRAAAYTRERASRERLEVALKAANMGTWDWDVRANHVAWSPQLEALHGLEPGTFGSTFEAYVAHLHPDDADQVRASITASLERGDLHLTYRATWPNGDVHWYEARGQVVRDAAGEPLALRGVCVDVTARNQVEQALRESEERFRTLADNIAQLAWMADATGWIFWYNQRWYDYTGTTLEQMQGWGWTTIHHPAHVDRVVERIKRSWETGEPWEDTFPLRGRDGQYRWFLSYALPIRDEHGRIARWFGTNTDITERDRLLASEHSARELAEAVGRRLALQYDLAELLSSATPDATPPVLPVVCRALGWDWGALWRVDDDAGVLRCAEVYQSPPGTLDAFEAASRGLSLAPGEGLLGRVWQMAQPTWVADLASEPAFTRAEAARQAGLRSGVVLPLHVGRKVVGLMSLLSREARPPDRAMLPMLVGIGGQVGQFLERRLVEETLRRQAALLELEPAAVIVRDARRRIVYWNPAAEALYGWSSQEAQGQVSYHLLGTRFPTSLEAHQAALERDGAWDGELVRRRRDGRELTVASRWLVLRDGRGEPQSLEVSTDITERKQAEADRARLYESERAARAAAEAAIQARDEFVEVVSHDLRNPLAAVNAHIQMVRRQVARGDVPTPDELVARLDTIQASIRSLSAQIDELHDATRLQSGHQLELQLRPTNLVTLARTSLQTHEATSDTHRFHLHTHLPELIGNWDAARLERVLANLLSNAIKYSPDGGDVTITLTRDGSWAVLSVEDHGLGIPTADLPHVFERYRRASNVASQIVGSGLGLAGAQDIVEQHGGTLTVHSLEGHGSTFTVRLPLPNTTPADTP